MKIQELEQKLHDSLEKLLTLEIVTVVGTYDAKTKTPGSSSKMIRTRLDILQGDKVTEIDEAFSNEPLTALRDYHAKVALEIYPPSPTLRDVLAGFGQVHTPFGLTADTAIAAATELGAVDPTVAAATEHLVRLVLSFRASSVQAVAMLPVMQ